MYRFALEISDFDNDGAHFSPALAEMPEGSYCTLDPPDPFACTGRLPEKISYRLTAVTAHLAGNEPLEYSTYSFDFHSGLYILEIQMPSGRLRESGG